MTLIDIEFSRAPGPLLPDVRRISLIDNDAAKIGIPVYGSVEIPHK